MRDIAMNMDITGPVYW